MKVSTFKVEASNRCRFMLHVMLVLLFAGVLAACQCGSQTPKDPHWSKDTCALCRMAVSDPGFAAQVVGPGYAVRHYDDLGCALKDIEQAQGAEKGDLYIKAKDSGTWLLASEARYVGGQQSPMNYGFAAVEGGELGLAEVRDAIINGSDHNPADHEMNHEMDKGEREMPHDQFHEQHESDDTDQTVDTVDKVDKVGEEEH